MKNTMLLAIFGIFLGTSTSSLAASDLDTSTPEGSLAASGTIIVGIGASSPTNAFIYAGSASLAAAAALSVARKLSGSPLEKEKADFMIRASKYPQAKAESPILAQAISEQREKLLAENVDVARMSDADILSSVSSGSAK